MRGVSLAAALLLVLGLALQQPAHGQRLRPRTATCPMVDDFFSASGSGFMSGSFSGSGSTSGSFSGSGSTSGSGFDSGDGSADSGSGLDSGDGSGSADSGSGLDSGSGSADSGFGSGSGSGSGFGSGGLGGCALTIMNSINVADLQVPGSGNGKFTTCFLHILKELEYSQILSD